jgi:hypothetical protein
MYIKINDLDKLTIAKIQNSFSYEKQNYTHTIIVLLPNLLPLDTMKIISMIKNGCIVLYNDNDEVLETFSDYSFKSATNNYTADGDDGVLHHIKMEFIKNEQ